VGADLTRLPVPPRETVQPYDPVEGLTFVESGSTTSKSSGPEVGVASIALGDYGYWTSGEAATTAITTKPGEWLEFPVNLPRAGRFLVLAQFVRTPESGIVRCSINGRTTGESIDLYAPEVSPMPLANLGELDLPARPVTLRVEVVGKNRESKGHQFALDWFSLRRRE
jgi:hypothetical protein